MDGRFLPRSKCRDLHRSLDGFVADSGNTCVDLAVNILPAHAHAAPALVLAQAAHTVQALVANVHTLAAYAYTAHVHTVHARARARDCTRTGPGPDTGTNTGPCLKNRKGKDFV